MSRTLYDIRHLYTFANFSRKLTTKHGKKGISRIHLKRLMQKHQCNFEEITIDGVKFIHCPHEHPTYS